MNGWAPSTRTYDAEGQLISFTVSEPRFTPGEVDLLIASRRNDDEPRGPHGFTIAEATDPKNRYRFRPGVRRRDFAQEVLKAQIKADQRTFGDDYDRYAPLYSVELDEG